MAREYQGVAVGRSAGCGRLESGQDRGGGSRNRSRAASRPQRTVFIGGFSPFDERGRKAPPLQCPEGTGLEHHESRNRPENRADAPPRKAERVRSKAANVGGRIGGKCHEAFPRVSPCVSFLYYHSPAHQPAGGKDQTRLQEIALRSPFRDADEHQTLLRK